MGRPGGAHQRRKLALLNRQVQPLEDRHIPRGILEMHILNLNLHTPISPQDPLPNLPLIAYPTIPRLQNPIRRGRRLRNIRVGKDVDCEFVGAVL